MLRLLGSSSMKYGKQTLGFNLSKQRVTLWGAIGDALLAKKERKPGVFIVTVTSTIASYYLGQLCLSSSSLTLIIDGDDDILALKELKCALSGLDLQEGGFSVIQSQRRTETIEHLLR